jgi:transcriptional regulator with XRE-family HTH domain
MTRGKRIERGSKEWWDLPLVARRLRDLRESRKMTRPEFEAKTTIAIGTIQRIENGRSKHPRQATLDIIAKKCNVPTWYFDVDSKKFGLALALQRMREDLEETELEDNFIGIEEMKIEERAAKNILIILPDFYWNLKHPTYPQEVIIPNLREGKEYSYIYPKRESEDARLVYTKFIREINNPNLKFYPVDDCWFNFIFHEIIIFDLDAIYKRGYMVDLPLKEDTGKESYNILLSDDLVEFYKMRSEEVRNDEGLASFCQE